MSQLELLTGLALKQALADPEVVVFRYELNRPIFVFLLCVIAACACAATLLYYLVGLGVAFAITALTTVVLIVLVAYWQDFAKHQLVAVTPTHLMVGKPKGTWAIAWGLLDAETLGLANMRRSLASGALRIAVGGQRIPVPLYNPLVVLGGIEELFAVVLPKLRNEDVPEELTA